MDIDKDLTALLLLKDRPLFTWRWMSYADKIRFPFKVLIADGGADKAVTKVLSEKMKFENVEYEYVRYPFDKDLSTYYRKVYDALARINTPFVIHTANDDFCVEEGLRRSVDFLKHHKDYVASGGDVHIFMIGPYRKYRDSVPYYGPFQLCKEIDPALELSQELPLERLRTYFSGELSTFIWSAVHRTETLKEVYGKLIETDFKDLRFADHLTNCLTIVNGKIHRDEGIYFLRQGNPGEGEGLAFAERYPTFESWITKKGWEKDRNILINTVSTKISELEGISSDKALESFSGYFQEGYVKPYLERSRKKRIYKFSVIRSFGRLERNISKHISFDHPVRQLFRYIYQSFRKSAFRSNGSCPRGEKGMDPVTYEKLGSIIDFLEHPPFVMGLSVKYRLQIKSMLRWILKKTGIRKMIKLFYRYKGELLTKSMIKRPWIAHLTLYASSICDAHCVMCDVGSGSDKGISRPLAGMPKYMPLDLLIKILEDDMGKRSSVYFMMTEPLLAPELPTMLKICKEKGHKIYLATNGHRLAERAEEISPYVDNIQVSLDGPEEVHDSIRGKGFFSAATKGIKVLRGLNERIGITINYTIFPNTSKYVFEFLKMMDSLEIRIDQLKYQCLDFVSAKMQESHNLAFPEIPQTLSTYGDVLAFDDMNMEELCRQIKQVREYEPINIEEIKFKPPIKTVGDLKRYFDLAGEPMPEWNKCYTPWVAMAINTGGKAFWHTRCFNDYILGDVREQSLNDIFYGEKAKTFRDQLKNSDFCFPACARCCGVMPIK